MGQRMSAQPRFDYWEECLAQSIEEHGVTVTREQLTAIVRDVEGAHDCYGMAFHVPENPLIGELQRARAELKTEREKVFCRTCDGRGRLISAGPYHSSDTQCWKCGGEGKHAP